MTTADIVAEIANLPMYLGNSELIDKLTWTRVPGGSEDLLVDADGTPAVLTGVFTLDTSSFFLGPDS
jgi:hypothetical protein